MFLFIDTFSDPTCILLFDGERHICDTQTWPGKQREFDSLIEEIDWLISRNSITYQDLQGIVSIVWPGGFTGTRVTTLVANTLAYSFHTPLFPLTLGEFFALQDAPLPWISSVTKKEVLHWTDENIHPPIITHITDLPEGNYSMVSPIDFSSPNYKIVLMRDYASVISKITLTKGQTRVKPLYARDPTITLKKLHDQ